jgi:hypothetical protein
MKINCRKILAIAILILPTSFAIAHHSFAATFDVNKNVAVEGIVSEFLFKNPHVIIRLDVENSDGSTTSWMTEGDAATRFRHAGWPAEAVKAGDRLRISGSGTHDNSPMVWIENVELLDPVSGALIAVLDPHAYPDLTNNQTSPESAAAEPTKDFISLELENGIPNLTGAWVENRATSAKPPWSRDPELPFNEIGAAVQASWDAANDPQTFCDPAGPVRKAGFTPHPIALQQYPNRIVFTYEEYAGERVVYLGEEITDTGTKSHLGDSVARYEDGRLIVVTNNLLSNPTSLLGNYYSDQARVTEVYFREDDPEYGSQLTTITTLEDPGYLTEPWVISRTKLYEEGYQFSETECYLPLRDRAGAVVVPSL